MEHKQRAYAHLTLNDLQRSHIEALERTATAEGNAKLAAYARAALVGRGGRRAVTQCLSALNARREG